MKFWTYLNRNHKLFIKTYLKIKPLHCCNFGQKWHSVCFDSQPTENKESITQVGDIQNAKENNSKVSKNSAKIDGNIGGAVKKKTKKQIIPNRDKIEKNQENKKLVVDLDLLDPKLFSSLQGNRYQHGFFCK